MVNYNNGKIYKIECLAGNADDIYIGSTTKDYLSKRMVQHRRTYKSFKDGIGRKTMSYDIFDKYGINNCIITLLENVDVNSKEELLARESHYIRTLKCVNKVIPGRKRYEYEKEYEKSQQVQEYRKKYRDNNKEKLKAQQREYRQKPEIKERDKLKKREAYLAKTKKEIKEEK